MHGIHVSLYNAYTYLRLKCRSLFYFYLIYPIVAVFQSSSKIPENGPPKVALLPNPLKPSEHLPLGRALCCKFLLSSPYFSRLTRRQWFTQFLLPSPPCTASASRLHNTLSVLSLLLLSNILTTTLISALLYPLHHNSLLTGTRKYFVKFGLLISYLVLGISFVLIAIAVEIGLQGAEGGKGEKWLGWVGVAVFGLVCVGIAVLAYTEKAPKSEASTSQEILTAVGYEVPTLGKKRIYFIVVIFVLEVVGLVAFLVLGGQEIVKGSVEGSCPAVTTVGGNWSKSNPLPVDVIGQQAVDVVVVVTVTEACGACGGAETAVTASTKTSQTGEGVRTVPIGSVTTTSTTSTVWVTV
jgi:hypothetical protein